MANDKTALGELIWLNRLRQPKLEAQNRPTTRFSEATQGDACPLGCACLPWDYCDCVCHSKQPDKRRPAESTPVL